jgi:hypothetical protein
LEWEDPGSIGAAKNETACWLLKKEKRRTAFVCVIYDHNRISFEYPKIHINGKDVKKIKLKITPKISWQR